MIDLRNKVSKLRPNVKFEDYTVQDDSDGKGPFISSWSSNEAQPTITELDSVDDSPPEIDVWKASMAKTDAIPRFFEDYITENNVSLSDGRIKDNYDAKIALRATKP